VGSPGARAKQDRSYSLIYHRHSSIGSGSRESILDVHISANHKILNDYGNITQTGEDERDIMSYFKENDRFLLADIHVLAHHFKEGGEQWLI
jgi:hypothetical protein